MKSFSGWYRTRLRPALPGQAREQLELGRTKDGVSLALPVHVLGVAGVGKSTLLNALLSDWMPLLPQGGVGSLTSTPVRIVYAAEPYLAIRCRARSVVEALVASLRRDDSPMPDVQKARLLVQGTQFGNAPVDYLMEVLTTALAGRLAESTHEADRGRADAIAAILGNRNRSNHDDWHVIEAARELPQLRHELEVNAAGFLAPLAAEIELGWATPFLASGVQLVDLPGLGVAHDIQQRHAESALAGAQACIVVVDRSGITEVCATALRPLLLHLLASERPDWGRLIVVVTQLDQIAREQRAVEPREIRRSWQWHFDELGRHAHDLVRGQLAQQLATVGLSGEALRDRRTEICSSVRVVHAAPLEHRQFHRRDDVDHPSVADEAGGGILRLRAELAQMGADWQRTVLGHLIPAAANGDPQDRAVALALRGAVYALSTGTLKRW